MRALCSNSRVNYSAPRKKANPTTPSSPSSQGAPILLPRSLSRWRGASLLRRIGGRPLGFRFGLARRSLARGGANVTLRAAQGFSCPTHRAKKRAVRGQTLTPNPGVRAARSSLRFRGGAGKTPPPPRSSPPPPGQHQAPSLPPRLRHRAKIKQHSQKAGTKFEGLTNRKKPAHDSRSFLSPSRFYTTKSHRLCG